MDQEKSAEFSHQVIGFMESFLGWTRQSGGVAQPFSAALGD